MSQLTSVPVKLEELVKNGVVKVAPAYVSVPKSDTLPAHIVFKADGDGQSNFIVMTTDLNIASKQDFAKAARIGRTEVELVNPELIGFTYPENGEEKLQLALKAETVKIKGAK
ncbi:hypothetical protein [Pseudolactococcus insecticola]|uniref:Uncharacterized protein n=1 Tax=Pseudolactococcus insecticola TaxID=2709158 RepID=A0A6A0B602_9LACT|nr:hypothetical protein [Lactococcus insecticola]GFH40830.1 hypothetical protein Hs20B_12280 [Lactococcus insecticola]